VVRETRSLGSSTLFLRLHMDQRFWACERHLNRMTRMRHLFASSRALVASFAAAADFAARSPALQSEYC
jgi:hypothetical protein